MSKRNDFLQLVQTGSLLQEFVFVMHNYRPLLGDGGKIPDIIGIVHRAQYIPEEVLPRVEELGDAAREFITWQLGEGKIATPSWLEEWNDLYLVDPDV